MLDSIHHVTLKLIKKSTFGRENVKFCQLLRNVIMDLIR